MSFLPNAQPAHTVTAQEYSTFLAQSVLVSSSAIQQSVLPVIFNGCAVTVTGSVSEVAITAGKVQGQNITLSGITQAMPTVGNVIVQTVSIPVSSTGWIVAKLNCIYITASQTWKVDVDSSGATDPDDMDNLCSFVTSLPSPTGTNVYPSGYVILAKVTTDGSGNVTIDTSYLDGNRSFDFTLALANAQSGTDLPGTLSGPYLGATAVARSGYVCVTPPGGGTATIGSAASGATLLASSTAQAAYYALWGNPAFPISGGQGANAPADWAANKTLDLTVLQNCVFVPFGSNTVDSITLTTTIGQTFGQYGVLQTADMVGPHKHDFHNEDQGEDQSEISAFAPTSPPDVGGTSSGGLLPSVFTMNDNKYTTTQQPIPVTQPSLATIWYLKL